MKHNKYIRIALMAAVPLFLLSACSKKFLEIDPQGSITETEALKNVDAANQVVAGVYNTLYFGSFGKTTVGLEWALMADVASDDADKGSIPSDQDVNAAGDIDNFVATSNNTYLNNIWNGYYVGIARANQAIDILNQNSILDTATRNRLIGECRFLRGMYYFNLVRTFGGVPKIIRYPQPSELNNDEFQTKAPVDTIYQVIINDFQYGIDHLPNKGDASSTVGRATKGAAESFLAKVYLYQKNWQKAFDLSSDVINSGLYSLVPDYNTIFRQNPVNGTGGNNNSESIFEVQTGINITANAISANYSDGQGPRGKGGWNDLGFGLNDPSADLANAYEPGDTRKNATIIFINPTVAGSNTGTVLWDGFRIPSQDSVQNQRYNYKAYASAILESVQKDSSKDTKPKNIRLMRYSEVLLIYAEAGVMLSNGDATIKLNMVRARANLPASTATQQSVWQERRVELGMEQDRFFDLVRQGRAGVVMRAAGKNFTDGKNEVFPIPQPQIDLSGGRLKQNNGY